MGQLALGVETNIRLVVKLPKITPIPSQSSAGVSSGLRPGCHPRLKSFSPNSVGCRVWGFFFLIFFFFFYFVPKPVS